MIDYIDLTYAFVDTLRRIPELVEDLEPAVPESIYGYIDVYPQRNSVDAARYDQKPGTVMVAWVETETSGADIPNYLHRVELYVRAQSGQSVLKLVKDIINGIPDPGDGQRWLHCPVMEGLYRTTVTRIGRDRDSEQIDVVVIYIETPESGDA